jgi:23S rRNA (cytidine1920-2'-O)/16S rRNA (cytidine1409-2'-O)-methyltransferase
LPVLKTVLVPDSDVIALVKPQFEAGREKVGKKGIVRDPAVHEEVLKSVIEFALHEGFDVMNVSYSPITGGDGNIEFLLHLRFSGARQFGENRLSISVAEVVKKAHSQLKNSDVEERE